MVIINEEAISEITNDKWGDGGYDTARTDLRQDAIAKRLFI